MDAKETQEFLAQFNGENIPAVLFYGKGKFDDKKRFSVSIKVGVSDDGKNLYKGFNVRLSQAFENEYGMNATESWNDAVEHKMVKECTNAFHDDEKNLSLLILFNPQDVVVKTNNINGNQYMVLNRFAPSVD